MDKFRTDGKGRCYRLVFPARYDPLRGKCWVTVEREGVERPEVLAPEEWAAMRDVEVVAHAAA